MSEVWINDVDLADYGFILGADPTHGASPALSDASGVLLGALGPAWLGEPVQATSRKLTVSGHIVGASQAAYLRAVDAIKALAGSGAVRIRFADRPMQEFRDARLLSVTPTPKTAILTNLAADLALSFDVADPLRYDVNPQGVGLSAARTALPIGTAPSWPVLKIHGGGNSLTNPVLTYRNASGEVKQTMSFTGTLGANDYLDIDCGKTQITKVAVGVAADALSWWTSGDFPTIRAADGSWELGAYPTLELSASSGVPIGTATFTRAWL